MRRRKSAVDISAAADLVRILREPRIAEAAPIHRYQCPNTRHGKKFGSCDCGAKEMGQRLTAIYQRLGLACKACGAYKAKRGSGHFIDCRYSFRR